MDFTKLNPPFTEKFLKTDFSKYIREDCEINWCIDKKEFEESEISLTKTLSSRKFPEDNNANFKWQIKFCPFGEIKEKIKYTSIFLHLIWRRVQIPVLTVAHFSLKANSGLLIEQSCTEYKFETYNGYGFRNFVSNEQLIEKSFIVSVKVSAQYEISNFSFEQNLLDNFFSLLDDDSFSDMTIDVEQDKGEFKVHRNILACRSKVFATMFAHAMEETLTGRVVIKDFPSSTVKKLLNFIYGCKTEFSSVNETFTLLEISDKYDVIDLKNQCVEYLIMNLNENNAMNILLKSNMYNILDLKAAALTYICENKASFSDPAKYKILKTFPDLIIEIATTFANDSNSK